MIITGESFIATILRSAVLFSRLVGFNEIEIERKKKKRKIGAGRIMGIITRHDMLAPLKPPFQRPKSTLKEKHCDMLRKGNSTATKRKQVIQGLHIVSVTRCSAWNDS